MKFFKLKNNKWFRILSNKYLLITILFIVWMLFFDTNSYLIHRELNKEIESLKENTDYYQKEIDNDKSFMEKMEDSFEMERFAREKYYLKKENEDIYIIEHEDSIEKRKEK